MVDYFNKMTYIGKYKVRFPKYSTSTCEGWASGRVLRYRGGVTTVHIAGNCSASRRPSFHIPRQWYSGGPLTEAMSGSRHNPR